MPHSIKLPIWEFAMARAYIACLGGDEMSENEIVIPDEAPGAAPGLSFGDLIRYAPIIAEVIATLEAAVAGGTTEIPAIKVRIRGKRVTLGPCPIKIGD